MIYVFYDLRLRNNLRFEDMIIAITNHKGGTGKTTTAVNLGVALAKIKSKVLVVDLDPQGNLSYSLGYSEIANDLFHVFTGEKAVEEVMIHVENMDLLPSDMRMADIELSLHQVENREFVLKEILAPLVGKYDYIIIDCPPSKSLLTVNALTASDAVIIPMLLDVLSIQGVIHILETIQEVKEVLNDKLKVLGMLAINVDIRKRLARDVIRFFSNNFDYKLFQIMIRSNVKIAEAPSHAQSVFAYAPNSYGAVDFLALAKEIVSLNK